ncbi:MAG TPA: hypothetical protein VNS02_13955 [Rhizobiaceae bacterium]|nr:hypothetical protein [Rhizobiaceae bacterium]
MSGIVDLVLRLIAILAAYLCAALAASLFLHFVAWPALFSGMTPEPWVAMGGLFFSVPLIAIFVAYLAFVPSAVLIGISEILRYRSWVFHALAGGLSAFAGLAIVWQLGERGTVEIAMSEASGDWPIAQMPQTMAAVVAAGMIGGLVYWALCGRRAGYWLERRSSLSRRD